MWWGGGSAACVAGGWRCPARISLTCGHCLAHSLAPHTCSYPTHALLTDARLAKARRLRGAVGAGTMRGDESPSGGSPSGAGGGPVVGTLAAPTPVPHARARASVLAPQPLTPTRSRPIAAQTRVWTRGRCLPSPCARRRRVDAPSDPAAPLAPVAGLRSCWLGIWST